MRITAVLILAASQLTAVPFITALSVNRAPTHPVVQVAVTPALTTAANTSVFYMTPAPHPVALAEKAQDVNTAPL